jgi:hypothetical protein
MKIRVVLVVAVRGRGRKDGLGLERKDGEIEVARAGRRELLAADIAFDADRLALADPIVDFEPGAVRRGVLDAALAQGGWRPTR